MTTQTYAQYERERDLLAEWLEEVVLADNGDGGGGDSGESDCNSDSADEIISESSEEEDECATIDDGDDEAVALERLGLYFLDNELFTREHHECLGEHRMVIVGVPFVRTRCYKHAHCILYLPSENAFAAKWIAAIEWLAAGRTVSHEAHQEAMRDTKRRFGINPRRRRMAADDSHAGATR